MLLTGSRITLAGVITDRQLRGTLETLMNQTEKARGRNLVQPQTHEITFLGQAVPRCARSSMTARSPSVAALLPSGPSYRIAAPCPG